MKIEEKQLYERYSARLLAVCQMYIGDRERAEDVLHDSFIKIFQSLGRFEYRSEAALFGWMRTIAVHNSLDYLRTLRQGPIPLDDGMDIPDEGGPPGDKVRNVPWEVLMKFIGELPEGYRTIFNLFCLEGYPHAKIAKLLGIKEKTSSSQYFRARAMLANKIKDYLKNEQEN